MMVLLALFGGAVASGLLEELDWKTVLFGAVVILLVRPTAGWVGFWALQDRVSNGA